MDIPICEHIKIGGQRCGSSPLRGQNYCYYHLSVHRLVPKMNLFVKLGNPYAAGLPGYDYCFPYPEGAAALQIGFAQLIHGLSQEWIDQRRGRLLLVALQAAAANLRHADKQIARAQDAAAGYRTPDRRKEHRLA